LSTLSKHHTLNTSWEALYNIFSDLVAIAERIEQATRLGMIVDSTEEKRLTAEKIETKVHNVKGSYKNKRKNYQNKDTWRSIILQMTL
jgi:hypothetical protein